jgi:hypothetical protein
MCEFQEELAQQNTRCCILLKIVPKLLSWNFSTIFLTKMVLNNSKFRNIFS